MSETLKQFFLGIWRTVKFIMKRKSATWRGGGEAPAEAKQLGLTELGLLMKKGSPEELKGPGKQHKFSTQFPSRRPL